MNVINGASRSFDTSGRECVIIFKRLAQHRPGRLHSPRAILARLGPSMKELDVISIPTFSDAEFPEHARLGVPDRVPRDE